MLQTTFLYSGWEFIQTEHEGKKVGYSQAEWLPAQVPGHIHLDLVANGIIADPHAQMNEAGVQWVDEANWSYRTTFAWAPSEGLDHQLLHFAGLDTVCKVLLNGNVIASHDNMHVALDIDVTGKLIEGDNELRINFQSAARVGRERRDVYFAQEGLNPEMPNFPERAFVRKAQYMSGWDWGPRLVSCGIWLPVALVEYASRILDVQIVQTHEEDSVTVEFKTEFEGEGIIVHEIEEQTWVIGDGAYRVQSPALWTPEDPILRTIRTFLLPTDFDTTNLTTSEVEAEALDERTQEIGYVKTVLLREPDQWGESFEFEVNGRKIWARGANWIPDHSFPSIVSRARYREQLERAKDLGFNMLRVWGGGLYETNDFYDLCDELGILVWQDFPYGCSYYPDGADAQEIARAEAIANIKRIRNHPSLALWCGNNENLEMYENAWGGIDQRPARYYGEPIYNDILKAAVEEYDPKTSYIETSPIGQPPADKAVVVGRQAGPSSGGYGDQHYWDAWHGRGDWKYYADSTGRFSSEYGFASSCSLATWTGSAKVPVDTDHRAPVVRWHDKTGKGYETFNGFVELHYPASESLPDWTYYSQLNQRDAIRFAVEHYRRSEFCRGSLIWQLNDCWPVQSWAIIDSNAHYKAVAYELRRLYADAVVSITRKNEVVEVWAINDSVDTIVGDVTLRATHLTTGELLREWTESNVELGPDSRRSVLGGNVAGLATPDVLLTATWNDDETWQLLIDPKEARFAPPAPITISTSEDGYLTLEATAPIVDLMLTENGSPVKFLDNFVTIATPGIVYVAISGTPESIEARSLAGAHRVKITRSPL
jgi:beta-mannosidase